VALGKTHPVIGIEIFSTNQTAAAVNYWCRTYLMSLEPRVQPFEEKTCYMNG
jgi:hypothetical protein